MFEEEEEASLSTLNDWMEEQYFNSSQSLHQLELQRKYKLHGYI
jgi:hypothetical protein